jgi:hypothetical protein
MDYFVAAALAESSVQRRALRARRCVAHLETDVMDVDLRGAPASRWAGRSHAT